MGIAGAFVQCVGPQSRLHLTALELKLPPVGVFLLCGAGMWLLSSLAPGLALSIAGRIPLAAVSAGTGLAIGLAGLFSFRAAKTTVDPRYPEESSTVVKTGIYRWSRNPMYLGLLLVLSGWAMYLAHALVFIVLPVFVLYMNRFQILPEERAMRSNFGDDYSDYCLSVRRWV